MLFENGYRFAEEEAPIVGLEGLYDALVEGLDYGGDIGGKEGHLRNIYFSDNKIYIFIYFNDLMILVLIKMF